jgi:RNA polymerase sigma factor (sigma-70 family)
MTLAEEPGPEAGFWAFYGKTAPGLLRRAFALANGHLQDAEDVHQEAYLGVLRRWDVVTALSEVQQRAYLLSCLINGFRQRWRRPGVEQLGLEGVDPQAIAPEIADHVMAGDEYRRVCRAIAELPARQARVMTLYAIEGLETHEVARARLPLRALQQRPHIVGGSNVPARLQQLFRVPAGYLEQIDQVVRAAGGGSAEAAVWRSAACCDTDQ